MAERQKRTTVLFPNWFYPKDCEMSVRSFRPRKRILVIGWGGHSLTIKPAPIEQGDPEEWEVSWEITLASLWSDEATRGLRRLDINELCAAFRLSEDRDPVSDLPLIERYSATDGVEGKFIRFGQCLNIPCPGTGYLGDPNLSILVTDEIRDAVRKLLRI